jgi:hypothetical protein
MKRIKALQLLCAFYSTGEDREHIDALAIAPSKRRVEVLYVQYEKAAFRRKNLYPYFSHKLPPLMDISSTINKIGSHSYLDCSY